MKEKKISLKNGKVWIAILLALSMFLTLSACGHKTTDDSKEDDDAVADGSSVSSDAVKIGDIERLAGGWNCVSLENQGDYAAGISYSYDAELYVMYNGECYGSLFKSLYELEDDGDWENPVCSMKLKDGKMEFDGVSYNGEHTLDIVAEYKIADIQKSSVTEREDINLFYRNAKDDQLTIHITGSFKVSPTDTENINLTLVYEKDLINSEDNEGILWDIMLGDWEDNYGNKWNFKAQTEGLGFTMIADGKEYKGECVDIGTFEIEEKAVYLISFFYEDSILDAIYKAKIISYNGTEFAIEQDNGKTLTFKR